MESSVNCKPERCRLQVKSSQTTDGILAGLRTESSESTDGILVGLQMKCGETANRVLARVWQLAARPSRFTQGTTLVAPNIYVLIL